MSFGKRRFLLLLFLALGTLLWTASGQNPPTKPGDVQKIQVKVDMVSLPVVVTTRDGKRITDLQKEDFEIFEDKVPQTIAGFEATDEPITLVLALDCSGSMERKLARLQNEAIRFVNLLHPDDSVAIMSFADDVTLLEDFSIDRKRNEYGIKETRSNGWTALYEAVWLGLEDMLKPVKERKALVIFTDGVDTASRRASSKDTTELAKESQATIYSIYFNTESDMEMNRRSGGTVGASRSRSRPWSRQGIPILPVPLRRNTCKAVNTLPSWPSIAVACCMTRSSWKILGLPSRTSPANSRANTTLHTIPPTPNATVNSATWKSRFAAPGWLPEPKKATSRPRKSACLSTEY